MTDPTTRWDSINPILERKSPLASPYWEEGALEYIQEDVRILVVGAGGLGCELLKNLALSGFRDIEVIDLDRIDISNLNRQFLFRKKDVGGWKAEVAANFVMKRVKGVNIKFHTDPIQKFSPSWYTNFNLVIAGLDNIEARQWLNQTLANLVQYTDDGKIDPDSIIPMIDGGTEGFKGQSRVIIPGETACFECQLASLPPAEGFHLCTIASKPRKPEHCIAYALMIEWPLLEEFTSPTEFKMREPTGAIDDDEARKNEEGKIKLDTDNPEHMTWLMLRAQQRSAQFDIDGVDYNRTMQVVKNIIPAIASTNAIVAASCVNEAFKIMTKSHPNMNNYFQYNGGGATGVHCELFNYQRNPDCAVCKPPEVFSVPQTCTLQQLLDVFEGKGLISPSLAMPGNKLLYQKVGGMYEEDLPKTIESLGHISGQRITAISGSESIKAFVSYEQ